MQSYSLKLQPILHFKLFIFILNIPVLEKPHFQFHNESPETELNVLSHH